MLLMVFTVMVAGSCLASFIPNNMIQGTATCSGVSQDGTSIRWESLKVRYVQRLSRIRERRPPRNMRGEARSDGVRRHAQLNVLL